MASPPASHFLSGSKLLSRELGTSINWLARFALPFLVEVGGCGLAGALSSEGCGVVGYGLRVRC